MTGDEFSDGEFKGQVIEKLNNIERWLVSMDKNKVNRSEFTPVKAIAYGFVGLILTAVVGALIAQVVKAFDLLIR